MLKAINNTVEKNPADEYRGENSEERRNAAEIIAVGRKDLRLLEQSFWHGHLSYVGQTRADGGLDIELKVQLPPDKEERMQLRLSKKDEISLKAIRRAIKHAVIDQYVFPNLDKSKEDNKERKGLAENDVHIFRLIAQEILSALRPTEKAY